MQQNTKPTISNGRGAPKSGLRGKQMALFGLLAGVSGLAATYALTIPADEQRASAATSVQSGRVPLTGNAQQQTSSTPSPQEIARIVAAKVELLQAETPVAEAPEADKSATVLDAAKTALAAALARANLRRQFAAKLEAGSSPDATASGETVTVASVDLEVDTAPDGSETIAVLEEDSQQTADGEEVLETELTVAETLPAVAPLPVKRPAAPVRVATKPKKPNKPAGQALAYASAEDPTNDGGGVFSGLSKVFNGSGKARLPGRGSGIAVYDISAATVHMPDGTKLEAHSGIGSMMDNPKYVKRRNRGPTPPNVYTLRMRERRFHGVEAIRMLPADRSAMHGRDGMLTHTNLLRGRTGSHGCVAFKNYNKFLNAFKAGKVKKLIVVPEMDDLPVYMASL